ncbi:MAG: arsenosugar biosynthesis radical SAM (seleno)protein ArsS [Spirochaetota bacterium]
MEVSKQLEKLCLIGGNIPFEEAVIRHIGGSLKASKLETLQINVGYLCNLTCKHCHLEAGPKAVNKMPKSVFEKCLDVIRHNEIGTVDITGGAPELNSNLEWFIPGIKSTGTRIIVRTNLILLPDPGYKNMLDIFADNKVEIITSLPGFNEELSDRQRGAGTFKKIIEAIRMLNMLGYGSDGSGMMLNIIHNPVGAFLPGSQKALENEYRNRLKDQFGVVFNNLYCITNMPVGRYLEYLIESENYDDYFNDLCRAFNPATMSNAMCTSTVSVGWDGTLYDCDFNQALKLSIDHGAPDRIELFDYHALSNRKIAVHNHCYGCCAGAGSSCQGATAVKSA